MPNGCTYELLKKKLSLRDFVLCCAHAWFYDCSIGAPLPDPKVSDYYPNKIRTINARLLELETMSDDALQAQLVQERKALKAGYINVITKGKEERKILEGMRAQVTSWRASDANLKTTIIKWLDEALVDIDTTWSQDRLHEMEDQETNRPDYKITSHRRRLIQEAAERKEKAVLHYHEEVAQVEKTKVWLKELYESLPPEREVAKQQ